MYLAVRKPIVLLDNKATPFQFNPENFLEIGINPSITTVFDIYYSIHKVVDDDKDFIEARVTHE